MSRVTTQLVIEGKNTSKPAFDQAQRQLFDLEAASKKAGAALAGMFSLTVVASWVRASIDAADEARKLAQAAGVTTEAFTGLQWAASQSGVSTNELSAAFSRLNRTAVQAANGGKAQAELFQRIGVSVTNAEGAVRSGDQLLLDLAARFAELPDGAEKSAMAIELFGRSGAKLLPLLNSGADGIGALVEQAERLGLVISDRQAQQAEQFNDSLSTLGAVSSGAGNTISAELLPTLNVLTGLLIDVAQDGQSASIIADVLSGALKGLATVAIAVGAGFRRAGAGIGAMAAAAAAAASGDFSGARTILSEAASDYVKTTEDAASTIRKIWDGTYEEQGKQAADVSRLQRELNAELASSGAATADELKKQYKSVSDEAKKRIREVTAAEREANSEVERLRKQRLDIEERYSQAFAQFSSVTPGEASLGDAVTLKARARQALVARDFSEAQRQAQAALKVLQDLAAAGENTYGFQGFANELRGIEEEANGLQQSRADEKLAAISKELEGLKALSDIKITAEMSDDEIAKTQQQIKQLAAALSAGFVITPTIKLDGVSRSSLESGPGPALPALATGGYVSGPGTGTSDSILARLSNGEYVLRAAAVRQYGTALLDRMNGLQMPGFADGGLVETAMAVPGATPGRDLGRVTLNVEGQRYEMLAEPQPFEQILRRQRVKFGRPRS
ncbi:hypothetical protein ACPA2N_25985 [Ectopseudomonas hydrolytica]|uniref:hypothetical protein n=1 Tax=Ectopseudomonas hydrolytica TaxID=2493633 RepID=UPI003C2B1CA6